MGIPRCQTGWDRAGQVGPVGPLSPPRLLFSSPPSRRPGCWSTEPARAPLPCSDCRAACPAGEWASFECDAMRCGGCGGCGVMCTTTGSAWLTWYSVVRHSSRHRTATAPPPQSTATATATATPTAALAILFASSSLVPPVRFSPSSSSRLVSQLADPRFWSGPRGVLVGYSFDWD
ncbi:unnamed protein product [Diplocarpon coronariae]